MILEVVKWDIKPNKEKEFESAFKKAQTILSTANGYISHEFHKCIEKPSRYILLVKWETLEDHTVGFRNSDAYGKYRSMLNQYYEPGATMEHFEMVHSNSL